ncbi:ethanolamine ammonia-lyase reactivating factor EutA, partial [Dehalococcoidia bacterium]|nr:ethanolamine ammonia-lyase reactivating factor EutA [Dehalococcoidia bacterium]
STQTQELGIPILEPAQRIRATVIGASQYTVQVSGNTIYVSDESALPVRNLPVLVPNFMPGDEVTSKEVETSIAEVMDRFNLSNGEQPVALALQWQGDPTYKRIDAMAQGILNGLRKNILSGMPVVIVFEGDVAHLIGASLAEHLGPKHVVLSLDGLELKDFDYIDIGQIVRPALVAPVVIKSLVFPVLPDWYNSQEENHTVVQ